MGLGLWLKGFEEFSPSKPLAYSTDDGTSWTLVDAPPGVVDAGPGKAWAPKTVQKIYTVLAGQINMYGLYYYDGTDWIVENASVGVAGFGVGYRPWLNPVWCNEDDTYVAVGGEGTIWERDGGPGTAWTEASVSGYDEFREIHGTPDGSAVFAIVWDWWNDIGGLWKKTGSGWSEVLHVGDGLYDAQLRVVSETEVWYTTNVSLGWPNGYRIQIWKWDGASASLFFSADWNGTTPIKGLWVAEDGSEGWAIRPRNPVGAGREYTFLWYNGTSWSDFQDVTYAWSAEDITQVDGSPTTARLVLTDGSIRTYDGAAWDSTYDLPDTVVGVDGATLQFLHAPVFTAPYLDNLDPADGETGVYPDTSIVLDVLDDDGDLNAASVVIEVNDVVAWSGGAQQNGFVVARTVQSYGFRYVITPPEFLSPGTTVVAVYAEDLA